MIAPWCRVGTPSAVGIGPVGDVVVGLGLAEIAAFDGVAAVVDQEDYWFVVVSQKG